MQNSQTDCQYIEYLKSQIKTYEELLARSLVGYHSIDAKGNIIKVNDIWLDTLGYSRDEVVGQWFGNFIHENYREKFFKNFPKLKEKGFISDFTFFMKHKDGYPVELIFNGMTEKDEEGNFVCTHSAFHTPQSMRNNKSASTDAENSEKAVIRTRMELMSQMFQAVAHQWRQPLNALGLLIQDTEDAAIVAGINSPDIEENTKMCMELICRMSSNIDEFRNFANDSGCKIWMNPAVTLCNILSLVQRQLSEDDTDFSLKCECNKNYVTLFNDPTLVPCAEHIMCLNINENDFKMVVLNIIANARDAINKAKSIGSIDRGLIETSIKQTDDFCTITIFNNGEQIPDECIERIFDPYFSTKGEGQGIGLSMYFSRLIIEKRMAGAIEICNSHGGVTVTMKLPINRASE